MESLPTIYLLALAAPFLSSCASTVDDKPLPPVEIPNKADYETLVACGAATCDGSAQRIEGGSPFAMYNMACIVEAMRDRTPGVYGVHLDHTWGNGSDNVDYTLVIGPSGDIHVGAYRRSVDNFEALPDKWDPVKRCSLAAPNVFDACLAAVQLGQGPDATEEAWACVFPESATSTLELSWFANCAEVAPTCE